MTIKPAKKKAPTKKKVTRRYTEATLKKLAMLSGNQCAFPGCTNPLVVAGISESGEEIVGQICHIYAASDDGPRGKKGLTEEEKNAFENLILLCGHHHPIIDKQWKDYSADKLFRWKREHEAKALAGTAEAIRQEEKLQRHAFMAEMSDEKIGEEVNRIRRGRHFTDFPTVSEALALAAQVEMSRLSGGHNEVRARALAWCARMLSQGDTLPKAKEILSKANSLATTPEAALAEAFITATTNKNVALAELAKLNTPAAKSAALRIVSNADGPEKAIAWAKAAGLTVDSFDAEGKFTFVMNALAAGEWDTAITSTENVPEEDFTECPALLHAAAMSKLVATIEPELRGSAIIQVPFEARFFPLASEPRDLVKRREARALFERISVLAQSFGTAQSSNLASDYALWLGLRDPEEHCNALESLRESMRDPATSLRRLNLAIQFGIPVDLMAIEARIDQNVVLSGNGTVDDAFARFSLVFAQGSHKGVAQYIDKHRAQLYAHLQQSSVISIEIEALARAGLVDSAKEKLESAAKDGLPQRERETLARIIAEASGADPIAERRAIYDARKDLQSLTALVDGLEDKGLLQDLLPYAHDLLRRTRSVDACERVARCLNDLGRYGELLDFMTPNLDLIAQSEYLRVLWAWTLYREGRFGEAKNELAKYPQDSPNANIKLLKVNIAVASGAWDELIAYTNEVWANRADCSARELLRAAQLSMAVNGAHSKELVEAATEKEPEDPDVLVCAYSQATSAGWEQSSKVSNWIVKAAELSGNDGPIKTVSLKEIIDMKPEWDKRANAVWNQLKTGMLPIFAAAQALNRSLLDFYLVPALISPTESDVRRRNIVFAYSGARGQSRIEKTDKMALDLSAIVTLSQLDLLETIIARFTVLVPHSTLGWLFQERQKATFHQPSRIKDALLLKQLVANGTLSVLNIEGPRNDALIREVGTDIAALLTAAKARSTPEKKVLVVRSSPIHRNGSLMMEEADVSEFAGNLTSCFAVIDCMKLRGALTVTEEKNARAYLTLHVRRWPNEPMLGENADIYLDGLAVSHLRAAGVLSKLKLAGIKAFIDNPENEEADALMALQSLGSQQLEAIEKIRASLARGIASKRVRAVRTTNADDDENLFKLHPTYGVLSLAEQADAIVVDDRFINKHPSMLMGRQITKILTTLDILDHLRSIGALTDEQLFAHRTALRQWGYQLVPVTDEELNYHLGNAQISNGEIVETAELKAIRQSLLRAKMGKIVQLPGEASFLHNSLGAYIRAMKGKWITGTREQAKAQGDYLLQQLDIRTWAPSAIPGNERGFAVFAYANYALQITSPPNSANEAIQAAYYEWIEDRFLKRIKDYQPEVFKFMVDRSRELAVSAADQAAQKLDKP
jgi:hypothetical protein